MQLYSCAVEELPRKSKYKITPVRIIVNHMTRKSHDGEHTLPTGYLEKPRTSKEDAKMLA